MGFFGGPGPPGAGGGEPLDRAREACAGAMLDEDPERALEVIRAAVARGANPEDVVSRVVLPSVDMVQRALRGGAGDALARQLAAARVASAATSELVGRLRPSPARARLILGSARGDRHELGRKVVVACLRARLLEVTDLGADVPPEAFVDAARERGAEVIGISSMMAETARGQAGCRGVRRLLEERALSGRIRIIVGGAPFRADPGLWRVVGADGWAQDARAAAPEVERLAAEVRGPAPALLSPGRW